jgi:hypothetical protein
MLEIEKNVPLVRERATGAAGAAELARKMEVGDSVVVASDAKAHNFCVGARCAVEGSKWSRRALRDGTGRSRVWRIA